MYNELSPSPTPDGSTLIPLGRKQIVESPSGLTGSEEEEENTYLDIDMSAVTDADQLSTPTATHPPSPVKPPETPEEIRLLYARIDKSKKVKNRQVLSENDDVSSAGDRPLPPLPARRDDSTSTAGDEDDQHIYATLPLDSSGNNSQ